jgi:hypothetical protein
MALFRRPRVARDDLIALREWVGSHSGVEAYVEPQTSTSRTTVVLVAGDGEFIRRQVSAPGAAADFARSVGIPIYDTNRVGLPQRMRDYAVRMQGRQQGGQGASTSGSPLLSGAEREALATIARVAEQPVPRGDDREELRGLLRTARANAHPDRNNGDRATWDVVDEAAKRLDLA